MFIVPEKLWDKIKILIPEKKSKVGRPQKDPKIIINGIFYIIKTGAQWKMLPTYYGAVSTVHGIFIKWIKAGIFEKILKHSIKYAVKFLGKPKSFFYDTSSYKAPFSVFGGKNPTDRSKRGIKKGIIIDLKKIILSISIDAANIHDSKTLLSHAKSLKKFVKIKPLVLVTDSAFDSKKLCKFLATQNIALLASTNIRRDKKRARYIAGGRWRSEQIFGMQQWNRGIKICWAKLKNSALAFLQFVAAIHNFKLAGIFG